jgi:hypothetical protein
MELKVLRLGDNDDTTLGAFYINGILKCGTVEDEERVIKVRGETRVPNGKYKVALRKAGSFHNKYASRYSDIHKGMLCIYNEADWKLVKDGMTFQYILIHTGNTDEHTAGCLLLNDTIDFNNDRGSGSANAYKRFYPEIAAAIEAGEEVTIEYVDVETGK